MKEQHEHEWHYNDIQFGVDTGQPFVFRFCPICKEVETLILKSKD